VNRICRINSASRADNRASLKLSIVIVSYNTLQLLRQCMDSILLNPPSWTFEIIVVDNASSDGSADYLSERPGIKCILNTSNEGFGKANNRGIDASQGEFILFLNSDTLVTAGALDKLVGFMDKNPAAGIIGPKLVNADGKLIQMSWDFRPTIFSEVLRKFLSPESIRRRRFLLRVIAWLQRKDRAVPVVNGSCMMFRKVVFEKTGPFDEKMFLYFEEPDLCIRANRAGWQVYFCPSVEIIHLHGQSMSQAIYSTHVHYQKSHLYYYKKHRPKLELALLKLFLKIKFTAALRHAESVEQKNAYASILDELRK